MSLESILKPDQISKDQDTLQNYGKDWTTYFDIKASAVVFPQSTEDVVKLVHWARQTKTALIPSGGRTGLSGAAVATQNEVIVSFDRMNQIQDFNPFDLTVTVGPGVITEELQNFAKDKGYYYPVDFGARGSSQIGGNIATNAGGIKVVRYGLTRDWVTSLKVVTGKGEVLELNNSLVKNATGYDLRHLFIGSEGTLGFITEATMKLAPAPKDLRVLILGLPSLENVMDVFAYFKKNLSLIAFEMFSDKALAKVLDSTSLPNPLSSNCPFYIVTEVEMASESDEEKILSAFEHTTEQGWVVDGNVSQSEQQIKDFWRYREDISESLSKYSPYKNDISVRISHVPDFIKEVDHVLKSAYPTWEVVWFGHIGDGNLHINILRPSNMTKEVFVTECRKVDMMLFTVVQKFKGSISAEHGVGLTKKSFLHMTRSPEEIEIMRAIKKVFDPDMILNPGKVF